MIFSASYYDFDYHWGKLYPITWSYPKSILGYEAKLEEPLEFLVPDSSMLRNPKFHKLTESKYKALYREHIKGKSKQVRTWLDSLIPSENCTLLTYEPIFEMSYRNLVMLLVKEDRPDCYGGTDLKKMIVLN